MGNRLQQKVALMVFWQVHTSSDSQKNYNIMEAWASFWAIRHLHSRLTYLITIDTRKSRLMVYIYIYENSAVGYKETIRGQLEEW